MALEQARHGEDRADAHLVRVATGDVETGETAERLQAALGSFLGFHHQHGSGAVRKLRGVAGSDILALLDDHAAAEDGRKAGEAFIGCARTVAVVLVGDDVLEGFFLGFLVDQLHAGFQRHDFLCHVALLLELGRAALALGRVLVLVFAADIVALSDDLGGLDHRHPDGRPGLGQFRLEILVAVGLARALDEADAFHAAADGDSCAFMDHGVGGVGDRLQARGAEAVDRGARSRGRATGSKRRVAGHVMAGGAFRRGAAKEHVFNGSGFDAGAFERALDGVTGHGDAMGVIQGAAARFGQGSTGSRDDNGFAHGFLRFVLASCCGAP